MRRIVASAALVVLAALGAASTPVQRVQQAIHVDAHVTGGVWRLTGALPADGTINAGYVIIPKWAGQLDSTINMTSLLPQFQADVSFIFTPTVVDDDTFQWAVSAPSLAGQDLNIRLGGVWTSFTLSPTTPVAGTITLHANPLAKARYNFWSKWFRPYSLTGWSGASNRITFYGSTIFGNVELQLEPTVGAWGGRVMPTSVVVQEDGGQNRSGYWTTNGNGQVVGWRSLPRVAAGWVIFDAADIDRDGDDDLVLWDATGRRVGAWRMEGGAVVGWQGLGSVAAGYLPTAMHDVDEDGFADLIVRNEAASITGAYLMNGTRITGWRRLFHPPAGWATIGYADFDNDNLQDVIVWQPSSRALGMYRNLSGAWSWRRLGTLPVGQVAKGIGEFDDNGDFDVLTETTATRRLQALTFDDMAPTGARNVLTRPEGWTVRAVAAF